LSNALFVEIEYCDFEKVDVDAKPEVAELAEKAGYELNDMRDLFEDRRADLGGWAGDFSELIEQIAKLYPEVHFWLRACGEELSDTCVREFKGGEVVFSVGPWMD